MGKQREIRRHDPFAFVHARVHEAEGPARVSYAVFQASRYPGLVVWVIPARVDAIIAPNAMPPATAARVMLVLCSEQPELLWAAEEALRAGVAGFVIVEPEKPLTLTEQRRLQLAAEAGKTTGLVLILEGAGSNAAESRWHADFCPTEGQGPPRYSWRLTKSKLGAEGDYVVAWAGSGRPDVIKGPRSASSLGMLPRRLALKIG